MKWIRDLRKRNPDMGLIDFWLRLKQLHSYSRSVSSLYRVMRSLNMFPNRKPRKQRKNKPYHTTRCTSAKIQIDVKYVPSSCLVRDLKNTNYINTLRSMKQLECVIWPSMKNTPLIPLHSFSKNASSSFLFQSNVFKRIMVLNLPIV